ncbi:MAG: type II secretion system F family protein [Planctomycetaceae bacterium]|nr:type II secretion system F family protein [Planctomycetaceae bacterium]
MGATLSLEDIQHLADEVRLLTQAGLPLEGRLAAAARGRGERLDRLVQQMSDQLNRGQSLAQVIEQQSVGDTRMLASAVAAGIRTGSLPMTIEMMADFASDLIQLRQQILRALSYPVLVFITALLIFCFIVQHSLIRLYESFQSLGVETTFLEWNARFPGWPLLLLLGLVGLLTIWLMTGRAASMAFRGPERLFLLLPGIGSVIRDLRCYTVSRMLAVLVQRELPLPEALRIAGACSGSRQLDQACDQTAGQLERGATLEAIPRRWSSRRLPPMLHAMLKQTGTNEQQLVLRAQAIAEFYRERIDAVLVWLRMLMPAVATLVVGGGAVFCYALTVFGPVVDLYYELGTRS